MPLCQSFNFRNHKRAIRLIKMIILRAACSHRVMDARGRLLILRATLASLVLSKPPKFVQLIDSEESNKSKNTKTARHKR